MPIQRPTVLVLGAGASADFGFPLGLTLRNRVCSALETPDTVRLLADLGHTSSAVKEFAEELRFSGHRSVDVFLEANPGFMGIGKHAIAACLLPNESERLLFPPDGPTMHWYEHLAAATGAGTDGWAHNRLAIITFNYDRSLEHYFTRIIAQRRRIPLDAAYDEFRRVPVVHVHGSLGAYPESTADGLAYGAALDAEAVSRAAARILVVSEASDSLPTFDRAYGYLGGAMRILFLGFGFHPANVRRLRYFETPRMTQTSQIQVAGTNQGFTDREWEEVVRDVLRGHWSGSVFRSSVPEFLQHFGPLS